MYTCVCVCVYTDKSESLCYTQNYVLKLTRHCRSTILKYEIKINFKKCKIKKQRNKHCEQSCLIRVMTGVAEVPAE